MKILFVFNHPDPFIMLDRKILAKKWQIVDWHHSQQLSQLWKLMNKINECDLVFGWFASWHTFLPMLLAKLLGKPSILVIGGYDLAKMPSIGYGHQRGGFKKWISRWTMKLADRLITNSEYSRREAITNAEIPEESIQVIYHGVPDPFDSIPQNARENLVITVGNVDSSNIYRKGHKFFIHAAASLPEVKFALIGAWRDKTIEYYRQIAPSNVIFTGWIETAELHEFYQKASVYVQASEHEGFGMSVAEAMLGGCIPVVSRCGALPEVVNGCGKFLDNIEPQEIANAIREGMKAPQSFRSTIRNSVLDRFPLEKRELQLQECIQTCVVSFKSKVKKSKQKVSEV
jgi:glycosyltransferase involved in cell wall biosynthesis